MLNILLELCNDLRVLPEVLSEGDFDFCFNDVRAKAEARDIKQLLNWFKHKDSNPWILSGISLAKTKMSRADWFSTSFTTNIAESAHANSQREGVRLTIVSAITEGERLDSRFFQAELAMGTMGVGLRYGNTSMTGRTTQNVGRRKSKAQQKKDREEGKIDQDLLTVARELAREISKQLNDQNQPSQPLAELEFEVCT